MKKLLLILCCMLLYPVTASAQWHVRSCEVPDIKLADPAEFECLWNRANKVALVGKISCAVGAGLVAAGGLTMLIADPCCASGYFMIGALGMEIGLVITAVSIPIWVVGSSRLSKLRSAHQSYDLHGAGLELSATIIINHVTQQEIPGIGLTCRF